MNVPVSGSGVKTGLSKELRKEKTVYCPWKTFMFTHPAPSCLMHRPSRRRWSEADKEALSRKFK